MLIPKVITSLVNNLIVLDDVKGLGGTVVKIPALASNLDLTTMALEDDLAKSFHLAHLVADGLITVISTFNSDDLGDILGIPVVGTPSNGLVLMASSEGPLAPGAANLASAAGYAVLASSTITNTGSTVVTGNLGLYPGTSVTGFPPGTITGSEDIADSAAHSAQTDAMAAYTDLQSRTPTSATNYSSADLSTFSPLSAGVYNATTSAGLTGNLTLNGSATDVFIFQIGSTLTTAASATVTLTGGALARNVFWAVGSSATLGASTNFKGAILALDSITLNGSDIINGRLIALTAAVTISGASTVTKSTDAVGPLVAAWSAPGSVSGGAPIGAAGGDLSGSYPDPIVASVGGETAAEIASTVDTVTAATSSNTASTLVERDSSGNFSAGTITAALSGNASTATTAATSTTTNALNSASTVVNVSLATAPTSGQVLTASSGTAAAWVTPTGGGSNVLFFDSNPVGAGAADLVAVVPGLLATDTIQAVSMRVRGATTAVLIGWDTQANNSLNLHFTADPGGLAVVRVSVTR